jgi:hypothetical protein
MNLWPAFVSASSELFAAMGEQGTVTRGAGGPVVVQLYVDDAVQDVGQYGRVVGSKRVVSALNTDWLLARGDIVTVRGRTAKVDEILTDDGIVNTVVLHG